LFSSFRDLDREAVLANCRTDRQGHLFKPRLRALVDGSILCGSLRAARRNRRDEDER
jgi:hypothetical protein